MRSGPCFSAHRRGRFFHHIWPERAIDCLRDTLRQARQQLARLLEIPRPETSIEAAKSKAHDLIAGTSKSFDQARRHAELTGFEVEEAPGDRTSLRNLETTLSRTEHVFVDATSLASDQAWNEWEQLSPEAKNAESELRGAAAKRIEPGVASDGAERIDDGDLSNAFARWNETTRGLAPESSRTALVSRIAAEVKHLE